MLLARFGRRRDQVDFEARYQQKRKVVQSYLTPENLNNMYRICPNSSLVASGSVAHAPDSARLCSGHMFVGLQSSYYAGPAYSSDRSGARHVR